MGSLILLLRSIKRRQRQVSTLGTVHAFMSNMHDVERNMRSSQDEASMKKLDSADLASKAAVQVNQCSSTMELVSSAQRQTQTSLDLATTRMARVRQEIGENEQLSVEMAAEAKLDDTILFISQRRRPVVPLRYVAW